MRDACLMDRVAPFASKPAPTLDLQ